MSDFINLEKRIIKVTDSVDGVTKYTYDALGQLLTEAKGNQTVSVTYDQFGNIQSKNGISYSYGSDDANCCGWKDLLTAYNGKAITYDAKATRPTIREPLLPGKRDAS